jgi:hypothetical protein
MFVMLIPLMQLMGDHTKVIPIFNPIFNGIRLYILCLSLFICGAYTAFMALKFMTCDYWILDKPVSTPQFKPKMKVLYNENYHNNHEQ